MLPCAIRQTVLPHLRSAGLTKVSLRDYLIGCIGIVPGTLAFVYIGASTAGTMNEEVRTSGETFVGPGTRHKLKLSLRQTDA